MYLTGGKLLLHSMSMNTQLASQSACPSQLFLEITTRCNMRCAMCVKYAPESDIPEADMDWKTFASIESCLGHCRSVVLNGIGEPLLHPLLPDMVAFVRERLPDHGWVGFQTNGLLLTPQLAGRIVDAGVDTVCVSVDSLHPAPEAELHGGRSVDQLAKAMARLRQAAHGRARPLRLGVEFVFMRDTFDQLEDVVRWTAAQGGEYVLVSHVLPYEPAMAAQSLFNPNTPKATQVFRRWRDIAAGEGLDLGDVIAVLHKFIRSAEDKRLLEIFQQMNMEADEQGVWVHLRRQLEWDSRDASPHQEAMERAGNAARELGVELHAPPLQAKDERRCEFVENSAAFITPQGHVAPCHFLWKRYACYMDGKKKVAAPWYFGNAAQEGLQNVWASRQFQEFRDEVTRYEYPYCANCNFVPCQDVLCESAPFEIDCLGGRVPCGHCMWCMGGLQCLS